MSIRVTIWNEFRHEKHRDNVKALYPDGMHGAIASYLRQFADLQVRTATQDEPDHGLGGDVLATTDVMTWWGHGAHDEVQDEIVDKVYKAVHAGMGLVVLHSGHFSKLFKKLMGTGCDLKWREEKDESETLWVTRPGHPCIAGIDDHFVLEHEEMYGEFFDVPEPESTFLISSFSGGEVCRSGMTWTRGNGKIVYFRPGHEHFPTYKDPNVLRVIANSVRYAARVPDSAVPTFGHRPKVGWHKQPK